MTPRIVFFKQKNTQWVDFFNDSKKWIFLNGTDRTDFFSKYDSENGTLFTRLKELNFLLSMIQRIEPLFEYDSKNRTHFCLNTTQWIDPIFLNVTHKLKIFGWKIVNILNLKKKIKNKNKNWTFLHMTRRIEFF